MQRNGEMALSFIRRSGVQGALMVQMVPPQLYLRASLSVLTTARRLYGAGLIGRSALAGALRLSNGLSSAAHLSWRRRSARSSVRAR
jgi:hypothetical protein